MVSCSHRQLMPCAVTAWASIAVAGLLAPPVRAGDCPGAGDCCSAHAGVGCKNEACCEAICSIDSFCCQVQWDDLCAAQAQQFCAVCGAACGPACGLLNVECLDDFGLADEFSNRRVVSQLCRPDGTGYCTAWIVAAPDCLITAAHCQVAVGDSAVFNFECNACEGGSIKVAATFAVSQVLASNTAQDWTLFRVAGNPAGQFGLVSVDPSPVVQKQPVYGLHHAGATVKAYDGGFVTALNQNPPRCEGSIAVHAVSIAGSAEAHGAPVIRTDNHCVAGMLTCGPRCDDGYMVPLSAIWSGVQSAILAAGCTPSLCGQEPVCPIADHDCFTQGDPGCTDTACCSDVCLIDDFCCDVLWDGVCVGEAIQLCPSCGNPGAGDCLSSSETPFCNDAACCEAVCRIDPFCCNSTWDSQCATEAVELCGSLFCGSADAENCFVAHLEPYCNNSACCKVVCAEDPFCCDVVWDVICVDQALILCCPADLAPASGTGVCGDGDGQVTAADLAELLAQWGACPGCCADLSPPGAPDGAVGPADLAQLLAGWGSCS